MADLKTQKNDGDVDDFLDGIEPEQKRDDTRAIIEMMSEITGAEPKMWGTSIIGFADYKYVYESGREGEWFKVGLSPRKQNITLYIMPGFSEYEDLMADLGKHKTGKSCLYIKKLEDVDEDILRELIAQSVAHIEERYAEYNE